MSRLKMLPEERQEQIYEMLKTKTYVSVLEKLRAEGLKITKTPLVAFRIWYQLKKQCQEDAATTESLREELKQEVPGLTDKQLDDFAQRTFSLLAIRHNDPSAFLKVRNARFKAELELKKLKLRENTEKRRAEALGLEKKKVQYASLELFTKWYADAEVQRILASSAPTDERTEKLGQLIFKEDW